MVLTRPMVSRAAEESAIVAVGISVSWFSERRLISESSPVGGYPSCWTARRSRKEGGLGRREVSKEGGFEEGCPARTAVRMEMSTERSTRIGIVRSRTPAMRW